MEPTSQPPSTEQRGRRFGRSPIDAVDLAPESRPGVPRERPPQPWPNARFPPARMQTPSAVPTHGRPNKETPPVYGTAVPLRGVSGEVRRAAYRYPDHVATHWLLMLLGDRLDAWETHAWRVAKVAAPVAVVAVLAGRALGVGRD